MPDWLVVFLSAVAGPVFVLLIALQHASVGNARSEVMQGLAGMSVGYTVKINGQVVLHSEAVMRAIQQIRDVWAHHSHPTQLMRVEVSDGTRTVTVIVGRDSQRPTEFWVLVPRARDPNGMEIGRVTTSVFDAYAPR